MKLPKSRLLRYYVKDVQFLPHQILTRNLSRAASLPSESGVGTDYLYAY